MMSYWDYDGELAMYKRKSCKRGKKESKNCYQWSSGLGRCKLGRVPYTCPIYTQPREGTKAAEKAKQVRNFYKHIDSY